MNNSTQLERRYRRLLAFYPSAFRREREEEMLSVLMAGASDGRQRPRPAETRDLVSVQTESPWGLTLLVPAALNFYLGLRVATAVERDASPGAHPNSRH
jgi:hypothetical protein